MGSHPKQTTLVVFFCHTDDGNIGFEASMLQPSSTSTTETHPALQLKFSSSMHWMILGDHIETSSIDSHTQDKIAGVLAVRQSSYILEQLWDWWIFCTCIEAKKKHGTVESTALVLGSRSQMKGRPGRCSFLMRINQKSFSGRWPFRIVYRGLPRGSETTMARQGGKRNGRERKEQTRRKDRRSSMFRYRRLLRPSWRREVNNVEKRVARRVPRNW